MNAPLRHTLVAVLLLVVGYGSWLATTEASSLLLCFDDSFYYFEIARNLAAGAGPTFDRIHPTNGFHFLWMALCVPVYAWGFEGLAAVRVLLAIQLGLFAVALVTISLAVQKAVGPWPETLPDEPNYRAWGQRVLCLLPWFLALVAAGPLVVKTFVNGMESAVYAVCYAVLLWRAVVHRGDLLTSTSSSERWLLAVVASLTFLSRTDAGLMLLCLGLWTLPAAWRLGAAGWWRLIEVFGLPFVTIVGFLLFNQWMFGIPMQVSGELKRVPPNLMRGTILVAALLVPVVVWALLRGEFGQKFPRVRRLLAATGWFGIFVALLFAYYFGLQTFARVWYFGPAMLYGLLVGLVALADLCEGVLVEAPPEARQSGNRLTVVLAVMLLLGVSGFVMQAISSAKSGLVAMRQANREAAEWIGQNLPEGTVLGCWDAGVMGYFCPHRVVNLDGVVNGVEYLRAMQRIARTGQPETAPLIARAGVGYIVNHVTLAEPGPERFARKAGRFLGSETVATWEMLREWPFVFAAATNDEAHGERPMAVRLFRLTRPPGGTSPAEDADGNQ